ncbi:MAG TPA: hypothetical protein ENJ79_05820 [Gammaproteobacteria bacterium]|nr:hypothetical protein [Gammaproteobacteria bacterium]
MHTIYLHIDETLDEQELNDVRQALQGLDAVTDVEVNPSLPHDMLVEYEESRIKPMAILRELSQRGVHADIMTC